MYSIFRVHSFDSWVHWLMHEVICLLFFGTLHKRHIFAGSFPEEIRKKIRKQFVLLRRLLRVPKSLVMFCLQKTIWFVKICQHE